MRRYTVTLGSALSARLQAAAESSGVTLGEAMRRALQLYITAVRGNATVRLVQTDGQSRDVILR